MKINKIILSLILMIVFLFSSNIVKAIDTYKLNTEVSNENNEIHLKIKLDNAKTGIVGMQGTINYDEKALELKEVKVKKEGYNVTTLNKETGAFVLEIDDQIFFDEAAYINGNDEILDITFNIKKKKNTEVKLSDIKLVNVVDAETVTSSVNEIVNKIDLGQSNWAIIILLIIIAGGIIVVVLKKIKKK